MSNLKSSHDALIQSFHREIEASVQKLAAESERLTGEQFDFGCWHDGLKELLDDCLRDASIKLDSDESERAWREDALERLADLKYFNSQVL